MAVRRPGLAAARLLRLELRHNAMAWMLPVAVALFWFVTYRKTMAMPPLWNLRAASMQTGAVADFIMPVAGAAAWMGSRDARRGTTDLVAATARPAWSRLLATWAATTCWALAGYLVCLVVLYGVTAHQAHWGGPLWWPVAVVTAGLAALSAIGFACGTLIPSRFTAPVTAVAAFFAIALSTELIHGSQSYFQISPIVTGPWDASQNAGTGTFYPYLPDLAIAQIIFLAGLTIAVLAALALRPGPGSRWLRGTAASVVAAGLAAAVAAVALAGTGRLDPHGMITIPALHDAANDRPTRFSPVCSRTPIPVCLNPAYASYLTAVTTALEPVLSEVAGLPGAPVRVSQAAAIYRQGPGNSVGVILSGMVIRGRPAVFRMVLPDQVLAPAMTTAELAEVVRSGIGPDIVAGVLGDGPGASPAQRAVGAALMMAVRQPAGSRSAAQPGAGDQSGQPQQRARCERAAGCAASPVSDAAGMISQPLPEVVPGSPAAAAARRFAELPALARHVWLAAHLTALRRPDHPGAATMTAGTARERLIAATGRAAQPGRTPQARMRLGRLHAASRRLPASLTAIACCAVGLRIALIWPWDSYGALQLPLVFEVAAVTVITVTTASPFGEPERAGGRWLPFLRLASALALTAVAVAALATAGTGAHLAGGTPEVLRNVTGMTGIGLLCAAALGGRLAWTGPVGYLLAGVYGLYTQWHGPALTTPWIWPARPPHDLGAALCAGLVFTIGIAVFTLRGARDPAGEQL